MLKILITIISTIFIASCTMNPKIPVSALSELAPTGTLRAAINYGNPILATKNSITGLPQGVSVDISRELARRLNVPIQLVTYESAGRVVADANAGKWDVAFVAIDPKRAENINFTSAHVVIEGAYLVEENSPIQKNEEVDHDGVRIVVGAGSAYDLFLSRTLTQATIVRSQTSPTVVDMFLAEKYEVAAGVKQQLEADARRLSGLRLLDGRFMEIKQAMATHRGLDAGAKYLSEFVEEMKGSGFVAEALDRHSIDGASVAPLDSVEYFKNRPRF
jgi:polar amino acid transport system substrate-binding protein